MAKYSVLVNPFSRNGCGEAEALKLKNILPHDTLKFYNIVDITDYSTFFAQLEKDEQVILAGGDGTMNRFVNDTQGINIDKDIYYFATGTGNDFMNDLGVKCGGKPILINTYLKYLPKVVVKGKSLKFFNAIGYGIDGYCCEEGDRIRAKSNKPINYAKIALKGTLYAYHPTAATVTIDGVTHTYKRVWLAPTMHGRYYGGGMMMSPGQDRMNRERTVTTTIIHDINKWLLLLVFPTIFKGTHIKFTKYVDIFNAHEVTVKFDRPTAIQIDGETILGVTEYQVFSASAMVQESAHTMCAALN